MLDDKVLIASLTFVSVVTLGGAVIAASITRRGTLQARLRDMRGKPGLKDDLADRGLLVRILSRLGSMVSSKDPSSGLRAQMAKAGLHGRASVAIYLGAKVLLLIVGVVTIGTFTALVKASLPIRLFSTMAGAATLFFVPNLFLRFRWQSRRAEVTRHLSDVVDLLEICVSGGMGLDMAWNAVGDEVRAVSPLLADEMALTSLEMHLGADRGVALRHMAQRTGADQLSSLVAMLVQSERFGTKISDALQVFAASLREQRSEKAEESAEKMAVKMLFPMVVLIFPVVIIVSVGPAAITLAQLFGGG